MARRLPRDSKSDLLRYVIYWCLLCAYSLFWTAESVAAFTRFESPAFYVMVGIAP